MRFKGTQKCGWIALAFCAAVAIMLLVPNVEHVIQGEASNRELIMTVVAGPALALTFVILCWRFVSERLLNYAELRDDHLVVVNGLQRRSVALGSIKSVRRVRREYRSYGTPVRVIGLVVEGGEEPLFVSVANEQAFLAELRRRGPRIEVDLSTLAAR